MGMGTHADVCMILDWLWRRMETEMRDDGDMCTSVLYDFWRGRGGRAEPERGVAALGGDWVVSVE